MKGCFVAGFDLYGFKLCYNIPQNFIIKYYKDFM